MTGGGSPRNGMGAQGAPGAGDRERIAPTLERAPRGVAAMPARSSSPETAVAGRHAPERRRGLALSLLVHAALVGALAWGVSWKAPEVGRAAAELWSSAIQADPVKPVPVPPPPPEPERVRPAPPPPPPRPAAARDEPDAQIALEKSRREAREKEQREQAERERREERKRLEEQRARERREQQAEDQRERQQREREQAREKERERAEAAAADKAKAAEKAKAAAAAKAEESRLAAQREAALRKMMGEAAGAGSGGGATGAGAAAAGGPSSGYAARIVAALRPNIVFAGEISGNPAAEVEVRAAPDGTIIGRTLRRSSGDAEWDDAVLRALDRTGRLPRDVDGRVPASIVIRFRPKD